MVVYLTLSSYCTGIRSLLQNVFKIKKRASHGILHSCSWKFLNLNLGSKDTDQRKLGFNIEESLTLRENPEKFESGWMQDFKAQLYNGSWFNLREVQHQTCYIISPL